MKVSVLNYFSGMGWDGLVARDRLLNGYHRYAVMHFVERLECGPMSLMPRVYEAANE